MAASDRKGVGSAANWSVPAVLAALLTYLGVSNRPEGRQEPAPATPPSSAVVDPLASSPGDVRLEALYKAHRLRADDPSAMIDLLEPLARFYAPRIARESSLGSGNPGKSLDARRVVDWMLDPRKTGDDLRTIIAMVPDPARSGSPYRFDNTVTGLTVAMSRCGFLLDGTKVPWKGAASRKGATGSSSPAPATPPAEATTSDLATEKPGVVLFRRPVLGRAEGRGIKHELVLMFLVAETPIRGVNTAMLQTSLDLSARCATARDNTQRPKLRLIGPLFTGSQSSIVRAVRSWLEDSQWKEDPPRLDWVNGVAIGLDPGKLMASASRPGHEDVRLRNVIYGSEDMNGVLFDYLENHARPLAGNHRVALVTEETTGLGRTLQPKKGQGASGQATAARIGRFEVYTYTFPLQIAEMRRRYARDSNRSTAANQTMTLRSAERLRIEYDEGPGNTELLPAEDPGFTSAYDELRLLRVAHDINRRGIRFIWLTATDQRDRMFVSELLRTHCPDAQIIGLSNDPSFTQRQRIGRLRGVLFASTYPMWADSRESQFQALPEHTAYGSYNAVVAHLSEMFPSTETDERGYEQRLMSYSWPGASGPDRPPVWITVASQQGLLPLHAELPAGESASAPGRYAKDLWRPPGLTSTTGSTSWQEFRTDLRLLLGRMVAITSGVSPTLPLLLAAAGMATGWYCLVRVQRIRHLLGLQANYPLPLPPSNRPEASGQRMVAPYLVSTAEAARLLGEESDPLRSRLYGHRGLVALALGGFVGSCLFLWWSAYRLPTGAAFVGLFLLVVVFTIVAHVSRRFRSPAKTTRASRVWPLTWGIGLGLSVVWCGVKFLSDLHKLQNNRLDFDVAIVAGLGAFGLIGLAFLAFRGLWIGQRLVARPEQAGEGRVAVSVIFAVLAGSAAMAFLVLSLNTQENLSVMALMLTLVLAGLFLVVLHGALQLRSYWEKLADLTDSILSIPLGSVIDQLPNRLTSRLGSYKEALEGKSDRELMDRFDHLRAALALAFGQDAARPIASGIVVAEADLRRCREILSNRPGEGQDPGPLAARALATMLAPVWLARGPAEAYPDQGAPLAPVVPSDEGSQDRGGLAGDASAPEGARSAVKLSARTLTMAESYVALEVVRFLNRHLDLLWLRVTALTILTMLLLAAVNGYPFQPASCLIQWAMVPVVVSLGMVLRVLVGVNRNELISRVNKEVVDRSLLNLDFLGKIAAYIGPVLALLAALSLGVSDLLRLILGPFAN